MDKHYESSENTVNRKDKPGITADIADKAYIGADPTAVEVCERTRMQNNSRGNDFSSVDLDAQ